MKKAYFLAGFIITLMTLSPVFGAYNRLIWEQTYDAGLTDMAYGLALDSDDNVIVTGTSYCADKKNRNYYTIKYDKNGEVLWEKYYDVGLRDVSYDVAVDSNDNVIVTGTTSGKFFTIKYDKKGNLLWTDSPSRGNDDEAYAVAVDSEDNIIITGRTKIIVYNYYTIKYDKNGKMLWNVMWTNGEDDVPYDVAVDSKDNIIVTGFSSNGVDHKGRGDYTYYTFKYDKDGKYLWHGKWATSYSYAEAYGVTTDLEDNVIVTGFVMEKNNRDYFTVKCNPEGKILWQKTYDRDFYDCAYDVATDKNNNVYVTGISYSGAGNYDFCTIKYNPSGEFEWEKIHDFNRNDMPQEILISSDGNIIIAGSTDSITWDFLTIKFKSKWLQ